MIKVKKLNKVYGKEFCVLQDITFELHNKGLVVISGESGSGKTTLLNCLQGIESYDGDIIFDNVIMTKTNVSDIQKEYFSMVYQDYQLIEDMTVESNLRIAGECIGKSISNEIIYDLLASVGLDKSYAKKKCGKMSGGEKQRIAIARALMQDSKIIIADEPTGNLDSSSSEMIWQIFKNLSKDKLVVIVTHNMEQANLYADYVIELCDGQIIHSNLPIDWSASSALIDSGDVDSNKKLRKTKLSRTSILDLLKWLNKDRLLIVLLSVFSIILMGASMVMNSFYNVNHNDLVIKNLKNNPEHVVGIEATGAINCDEISGTGNVSFGYHLSEGISFHGSSYAETPRPTDLSKLYKMLGSSDVIESSDVRQIGVNLKYGRNSTNTNEIVINEFVARSMLYSRELFNGKTLEKEEDVLGIILQNNLTIVGVIDINLDKILTKFNLERADYTYNEVSELDAETRSEFVKMETFIANILDTKLMVIAEGYAKAKDNDNNCTGVYLSSINPELQNIYQTYSVHDELNIKINSIYTYGMDRVVKFFEENKLIFTVAMVALTVLSIVFVGITAFLMLKNKINDLLILRSLNINKYKLSAIILLSYVLLLLLQIVVAVCVNIGLIAILNANFAKILTQSFKTLFFSWKFIAYLFTGCISALAVFIAYILNLFKKPVNQRKQNNQG